jgi:hypothetical protein
MVAGDFFLELVLKESKKCKNYIEKMVIPRLSMQRQGMFEASSLYQKRRRC